MTKVQFSIKPEQSQDVSIIENLNALAFGPGRFALTAYRVREMAKTIEDLCFTAWIEDTCIGSIRHSLVACGHRHGLMLGPLVVHPDQKSQGCGLALIEHAMKRATAQKYKWVILVGDHPYYSRAGFEQVPHGQISFPGPVDPARILLRELQPGSLAELHGTIRPLLEAPV